MKTHSEPSVCPRCGKSFHCSKSGKCWCYEVYLPLDKLEEIERLYDRCLCPACLTAFTGPVKPVEGKYNRSSWILSQKKRGFLKS